MSRQMYKHDHRHHESFVCQNTRNFKGKKSCKCCIFHVYAVWMNNPHRRATSWCKDVKTLNTSFLLINIMYFSIFKLKGESSVLQFCVLSLTDNEQNRERLLSCNLTNPIMFLFSISVIEDLKCNHFGLSKTETAAPAWLQPALPSWKQIRSCFLFYPPHWMAALFICSSHMSTSSTEITRLCTGPWPSPHTVQTWLHTKFLFYERAGCHVLDTEKEGWYTSYILPIYLCLQ